MENPATWGRAERIVDTALKQWDEAHAAGFVGASRAMLICDALRKEGLLPTHFVPYEGENDEFQR